MPLAKIISSKLFGGLDNNLRTKAQKVLKEKALYDWLEYLKRIEGSGYGEFNCNIGARNNQSKRKSTNAGSSSKPMIFCWIYIGKQ